MLNLTVESNRNWKFSRIEKMGNLPAITLAVLAFIIATESTLARQISNEKHVTVNVPGLGQIRGGRANTLHDKNIPFWSFLGIPYAKPESYTGENRFKPSVLNDGPLRPDGKVFVANKFLKMCPQNGFIDFSPGDEMDIAKAMKGAVLAEKNAKKLFRESKLTGRSVNETIAMKPMMWGAEDCLAININTPSIPEDPEDPSQLKPVILFIHGGGADSMWGSVFAGFRLLEFDVVLVNINYRLGTLGFFNLQIDSAPGNMGLWDSKISLEWIQKYIKYFGGDPNRVTISGQSAGGMMVTHLMLSPKSKHLFHGVIGLSGSALSCWATAAEPVLPHHLRVAKNAGCYDGDDSVEPSIPEREEIVACMRQKEPSELVAALDKYKMEEQLEGRLGYDARVISVQEFDASKEWNMVPKHPIEVLKAGEQANIPLMLGALKHDGSFPMEDIYDNFVVPNNLEFDEKYIRNDLMYFLLDTALGARDDNNAIYHSFVHTYFGEATNTADLRSKMPGMLDMVTVMGFAAGAQTMIELHSKINPNSYYYSFDYYGSYTLYEFIFGTDSYTPGGIAHSDDLLYLFLIFPFVNQKDKDVSNRFLNYWKNFIHYGNPNGENPTHEQWPKYDDMLHSFLIIEDEDRIGWNMRDHYIGVGIEAFPEYKKGTTPSLPEMTTFATTKSKPSPSENSSSSLHNKPITIFTLLISFKIFYHLLF